VVKSVVRDLVYSAPPAETNVPPQSDNGCPGQMSFLDHVMEQSFHFLFTGETVQSCTGACDPD